MKKEIAALQACHLDLTGKSELSDRQLEIGKFVEQLKGFLAKLQPQGATT